MLFNADSQQNFTLEEINLENNNKQTKFSSKS